jgi:lipopolysaccharide export system permease protein
MSRVNNYLLRSFSSVFSSLFFTLFFITSIVFFIKIASITSIIKINFLELSTLYIYLLPRILIYTMPLTFFIALSVTLYNLSKENETTVLFTLGYSPRKITKFFFTIAMFLTLIMAIDFLILVPLSKQLHENFINYKKIEAKFNIKATEFGQKFSDWLVYINKIDKNETYRGIVMYKQKNEKKDENLIISKTADIENHKGILNLSLHEGKVFQFQEKKLNQINFIDMQINSLNKNYISPIQGIIEYWMEAFKDDKRASDFSFFALISLFPLASTFFALSIGIVTYRYQKKNIYPAIAAVIFLYVSAITLLVKLVSFYSIPIVFISFFITSFMLYKKRIFQRY